MDCIMPILDGFEATKELRSQNICTKEATYIVALTANTSSQDKLACQRYEWICLFLNHLSCRISKSSI
ncbi:hypothetical protein ACOBV9_19615 (plasmid) [Pseudoalteromonas espejiana]